MPFKSVEDARLFVENYNHYDKYGFGRWAVIKKKDDKFIGWCGLKYTSNLDEYDIGFRFFKKEWNKGFATESAKACLDYGFNKYKMNKIVGRAMRKNIGSINVLEKIGLTFDKPFIFDEHEGLLFSIKKRSKII